MIKQLLFVTFILLTCFAFLGCDGNERVAQVAIDAAEQQAKQNERMAQNNHKLLDMQHDLQAEQAQVGNHRDQLEDERRDIASQRLTESRLGPILKSCAAAALSIVTIGFCWYLLYGLKSEDADQLLGELLIEDFVTDNPTLLPHLTTSKPIDPEPNKQLTKE
jgi:TolA-binding protein